MAYIGQKGGTVSTLTSKTLDTMTGDGSDATLTLSQTPASVNDVAVYLDGVFQRPTNEYTLSGNVITFTTAPANGVFVCAMAGGGEHIGSPMAGSVTTDKLIDGTITSAMVAAMSSSKLTGALAAVDGSALTGIPSTITKNASDPAIDTNPSGGVGTVWANTTDGEMFVCTDATTNENVWFNVGSGSGDVVPHTFQGTISGYSAGAYPPVSNVIDKFSLVSDADATDVGNLTTTRGASAGQTSATHGYTSGGNDGSRTNVIDRFSFTTDGDATDVGDMVVASEYPAGQSSETHGYVCGGSTGSGNVNTIEKFAFGSSGNATDIADMTITRHGAGGQSSSTHGYNTGGTSGGDKNEIDKFTFASDANATDVGDITVARAYSTGQSSTTHGYTSGGQPGDNVIDKFTFASNANATDVGDLVADKRGMAGQSSTSHGYNSGGRGVVDVIQKFPFASDTNSSDIANLTVARQYASGTQY
jgi:hypothetical protein